MVARMALQIVTLAERPDLRAAIFADDMQARYLAGVYAA